MDLVSVVEDTEPLVVTGRLSPSGGENTGHLPCESGTVFWAVRTTSATL